MLYYAWIHTDTSKVTVVSLHAIALSYDVTDVKVTHIFSEPRGLIVSTLRLLNIMQQYRLRS